jgi:hypothetical protein
MGREEMSNRTFPGEYTPVLPKHSKGFSLERGLAVAVPKIATSEMRKPLFGNMVRRIAVLSLPAG